MTAIDITTAALANLGHDAVAVAETLFRHGYRGRRGDSDRCPVACYLRDLLADDPAVGRVRVGTGHVALDRPDVPKRPEFVDLPLPVQRFVASFDHGAFDDLDVNAVVVTAPEPRRDGLNPAGGEAIGDLARHAGAGAR